MGIQDGVQHFLLGELAGAGLHHHHRVPGAGHRQGEAALGPLFAIGVDDILAVHHAHRHCAGGAHKGRFADGEGNGAAQHGQNIRLHILIHGQHRGDHLDVVIEALGEQGPQGPVDEPVRQNGLFAGTAFPLDETAGDLAHGVHLLFKFDAQGQKIHPVPGRLCHRGAYQHHRIPAADQGATSCLFRILACDHGQGAACQLH